MVTEFKTKARALKPLLMLLFCVILSGNAFSQDPDPGGNPDGPPPAVPFDDYQHLLLIAAGLVVAMNPMQKKKKQPYRV